MPTVWTGRRTSWMWTDGRRTRRRSPSTATSRSCSHGRHDACRPASRSRSHGPCCVAPAPPAGAHQQHVAGADPDPGALLGRRQLIDRDRRCPAPARRRRARPGRRAARRGRRRRRASVWTPSFVAPCAVTTVGGAAAVELALPEDVAQRVEVARGVAVRGDAEPVGAVALGDGADHVVLHRSRVVDRRLGGQRSGARHASGRCEPAPPPPRCARAAGGSGRRARRRRPTGPSSRASER